MKDPDGLGVSGANIEPTDAPVVTSEVAPGPATSAAGSLESIVEEAFDAHAGRLKAFATAAVRDADAADDLVQETFLRFVRQLREGPVPDNIGGWLYRVAANLATSRGRRRSVASRMMALLVDRSTVASAEEQAIRSHEHARLHDALAGLPTDARVALLMAAEGFSAAEIGNAIGRSAGATATYLSRARVRLRERLGVGDGSR